MSLFIIEAAAIGAKEALKVAFVWFAVSAFLEARGRPASIIGFYLGFLLATSVFALSFFLPPALVSADLVQRLAESVFFLFYLASLHVLFGSSGRIPSGRSSLGTILFLVTVFYFSPDVIGTAVFLRELSGIKGGALKVYASSALGFWPLVIAGVALLGRYRARASRFMDAGQLLVFLLVVKMLGGGARGITELSMLPSVQRGAMKFIHDLVHHTFVFIMVPDHPMLRLTTWNFIGIFFGPFIGLAVALAILLIPPLAFVIKSNTAPVPLPPSLESGADRRRHIASVRADRRRKSLPVVVFILIIIAVWFSGGGQQALSLYNPKPRPVVEDKGMVLIPLTDPTMDLFDGRIHKFSLIKGGQRIVILVLKKPGGKLAVCLDACEICPPDGYGQSEGNVTCIFCMTPIPVETLGNPGGCNPIPLEAEVSDVQIRISGDEIAEKWNAVLSGETKRGISK